MMRNIYKENSAGFTIIEVLAVITVLGILVSIAVISISGITVKAKKDVCDINLHQLLEMHHTHLLIENDEHTDLLFNQYLREYGEEICPDDGNISYVDGEPRCSVHQLMKVMRKKMRVFRICECRVVEALRANITLCWLK